MGKERGHDVTATIRDEEGHIAVAINDNQWEGFFADWDKNYTKNALEVRDSKDRVIFQLGLFAKCTVLQMRLDEWVWEGGSISF